MNLETVELQDARQILLRHSRSKKNGQFPSNVSFAAKLTNPICGDHVEIRGEITDKILKAVGFAANACAICTAASSLLCDEMSGLSVETALARAVLFEQAVLETPDQSWPVDVSGLISFRHLRENPARRVCALLPFVALRSGLADFKKPKLL